jgi:CarD family transcriptional regulator
MYSVNDKVVYPGHGVATVTQVINKTVNNESLTFYELSFLSKEITVLVPVKNFMQIGLRPLSRREEINALLESFCLTHKIVPAYEGIVNSWNKRNKHFQTKMRSGILKDLGSIYIELKSVMANKELSFGERAVLQQAEHLLAEEISLVLNISIEEAIETLAIHVSQNIMPPEIVNVLRS